MRLNKKNKNENEKGKKEMNWKRLRRHSFCFEDDETKNLK
jgi:hypothetical protein